MTRSRIATTRESPVVVSSALHGRFVLGPSPEGATESRVFDRVDDVGATTAGTLAVQPPVAELFSVFADMADLARHAADTLTD